MALLGIGTLDPGQSNLVQAGYLREEEIEELEQYGAVGDVCALSYDLYGNMVDVPTNKRIIGITAETLAAIPVKIGIAGGSHKVLPIIGASRAGLVDMLVTDEMAASSALTILRKMTRWKDQLSEANRT
jgi:DNA-binding transcriptional regulator LsrR (DeoR family)